MKSLPFLDGWTCRHLDTPGPGAPVSIPHDAARYEPRTATAPGGVNTGWYEAFDYCYEKQWIPDPAWAEQQLLLEFEGVYRNAEVWLNDEKLAFRPYGYTNFYVDITGKLYFGQENTLQVIARNADQPNSRWYSGAGIYRPVTLWLGGKQHIRPNDLKIRTLSLHPALVEITVVTQGAGRLEVAVLDGETVIAQAEAESGGRVCLELELPDAQPWHPDAPKLYTCVVRFAQDTAQTRFGLRTISWGEEGFHLNSKRVILQGACVHHDNGLLGAICDPDAVARKVRLLKENGYNAIRSAHNPCSKAMLDACDQQGMLLMDEYIDHWYIHKTVHDYVDYFQDWWKQDLEDMVDKDYNHPCVVLYSTGNEVSETAEPKGIALTQEMTDYLHGLDPTRPVSCGINIFFNFLSAIGLGQYSDEKAEREAARAEKRRAEGKRAKERAVGSKFFNDMAGLLGDEFMKRGATLPPCDWKTRDAFSAMDIAGYNYGVYRYRRDLKKYPSRLILGTETFCNDAYQFRELAKQEPRLIGDFVWAGMDYLGEVMVGSWEYADYAARFDGGLGWVSAGSGRIDLTGKPLGEALYTRVALEQKRGPYLAVRPVNHSGQRHSPSAWKMTDAMDSWSWRGCEGRSAHVEVYARAARVRLEVNGVKMGEKRAKNDCRFQFLVPYQNGTLEAVALDEGGRELGRTALVTAGTETELRAMPEKDRVASGRLCYIRLAYTDKNGVGKPLARGELTVEVEGGTLLALGNACPYNERGYLTDKTDTYYGQALAIIRAGDSERILLTATDGGRTAQAVVPIEREKEL